MRVFVYSRCRCCSYSNWNKINHIFSFIYTFFLSYIKNIMYDCACIQCYFVFAEIHVIMIITTNCYHNHTSIRIYVMFMSSSPQQKMYILSVLSHTTKGTLLQNGLKKQYVAFFTCLRYARHFHLHQPKQNSYLKFELDQNVS